MDYEASEDLIIARLAPLVTAGCEVVPLPDVQAQVKKPITKPRITVAWNGSDTDPTSSTGNMIQSSTSGFEITIQWNKKRGAGGIYALMKIIKIYLLGFELRTASGGKMWLNKEEFADYDEQSIWNYRMLFSVKSMEAEAATTEADILLSQLNFIQEIV